MGGQGEKGAEVPGKLFDQNGFLSDQKDPGFEGIFDRTSGPLFSFFENEAKGAEV
jgi:hypothetical protein